MEPISRKLYERTPNRDWLGKIVVTLREMKSGFLTIPPNTYAEITRKHDGFTLETLPCPHCGVVMHISKVPHFYVGLMEEPVNDPEYVVDYSCACGNQFRDTSPFDEPQTVVVCHVCAVLTPRIGMQVVYNHPERSASDAAYANKFLVPNGIYVITRHTQWQHHATLSFAGYSNLLFNALLFSPWRENEQA